MVNSNSNLRDPQIPHSPVDDKKPTEAEQRQTEDLRSYIQSLNLYDSPEESIRKQNILGRLDEIVKIWVKKASLKEGFDDYRASQQNAKIYTFGSYRLGVHGPGSDVDTLCVGPRHILRTKHFFGKETYCLENILSQLPEVTEVLPVPDSYVPLLKFTLSGISFDLLYAGLALDEIKDDLLLTDNNILRGIDESTARSLNGCRVTDTLLDLVPNRQGFILALKFIKEWAQWKGVCSNVSGYFGGVNWAISMAYTCLLYPTACAARLVSRFFHTLRSFPWPQALYLRSIQEESIGFKVWDKWKHAENIMRNDSWTECMPILTPAYPAMNSSFGVNLATREVILEELIHAEEICMRILLPESSYPTEWYKLLEAYPLFEIFSNFLVINLSAPNWSDLKKWNGLLQSKLRQLTNEIQPYAKVRPWPNAYEDLLDDGRINLVYFLGISVRKRHINLTTRSHLKRPIALLKMNLSKPIENFKTLVNKSNLKRPGMHFHIQKFTKNLVKRTLIRKDCDVLTGDSECKIHDKESILFYVDSSPENVAISRNNCYKKIENEEFKSNAKSKLILNASFKNSYIRPYF
jgi:poly(A) polymerase